jgi:hypothetical protein
LSLLLSEREELTALLSELSEMTTHASPSVDEDTRAALTVGITRQTMLSQAGQELVAIEAEYKRRAYARDPLFWASDRCGLFLWSAQRRILQSVKENRRTTVYTCHEVGKSFIASATIAWWIDTHRPGTAFAVTSAPTAKQVRAILWRELNKLHTRCQLPGRMNQTEWFLPTAGKEELVAFGQKPADTDPTAFQGIHAPAVLLLLDEACGIPKALWDAGDSLIANEDSRALAIGNPDDPKSEFAENCKPGSGWNAITLSAFDTPNFTGEPVPEYLSKQLISPVWVEEKKRKWGEDSPTYVSKILGRFPENSIDGLIPLVSIRAAQDRELAPSTPIEIGGDVGAGGDKNIQCLRRGMVARIIHRDSIPNTMETCGRFLQSITATNASRAKIDEIGVGRGIVDRAKELKANVVGVNVSRTPKDPIRFFNLRSEGYWELRERFIAGNIDIDPFDDDLAAQLAALKYKVNSKGQILIQSKDEIRSETGRSPDEADALMLAFLDPLEAPARKKGGLVF